MDTLSHALLSEQERSSFDLERTSASTPNEHQEIDDLDDVNSNTSVITKVRLILDAFHLEDNELSLSEISRRSGVPKTTVHRLAQELVDWGMLERSSPMYRLGMRAFEVGCRAPQMRYVRERIRPVMASLFAQTGQTIHLATRDDLSVVFLEKIEPERFPVNASRISGRLPLHCSATGKVLIAYAPESVQQRVTSQPLEAFTPMTTIHSQQLESQLEIVRERGFAVESEEVMVGVSSVAVPIRHHDGDVFAALSITAPIHSARVGDYVQQLRRASERISEM